MGPEDLRLRAARPPKPVVDVWTPFDVAQEEERQTDGRLTQCSTIFLAGRECPFTCVHCDLWRFTTDEPTPPGAIPSQIRQALERLPDTVGGTLKLYNASNFFDSKAVPPEDDAEIAALAEAFERVVVECHPRLIGPRCLEFADRLKGTLQVALGLETVHPEALPRLNKRSGLSHFRRAAAILADAGIEMRAFVLLGAPFVPPEESVQWAVRSAAYAFDYGAQHVALVPMRGGQGDLVRLEEEGLFVPPTLEQVEEALELCLDSTPPGVITVDTWDLEALETCSACGPLRRRRLEQMNLRGESEPAVVCHLCGPGWRVRSPRSAALSHA